MSEDKVTVPIAEPWEEKKGKKCCGCCCDFRRCVIVFAIIGIVSNILSFIVSFTNDTDTLFAIVYAAGLCFSIFELFAALKYNTNMLWAVVVMQLILLVFSVWEAYVTPVDPEVNFDFAVTFAVTVVLTIIFRGLFIYPVVGLIMEIKSGIMSKETYPREFFSCCCKKTYAN